MHARLLPLVLVGLSLFAVACLAGALDLPTVPFDSGLPVVSSADEAPDERSAILTEPLRLQQGGPRLAIRDDRWLNPGWELVGFFYTVAFGLMADHRFRCVDWLGEGLSIAWGYVLGAILAFPLVLQR